MDETQEKLTQKVENVRSYYEAIFCNQTHIFWNLFSNSEEGISEHLLYKLA